MNKNHHRFRALNEKGEWLYFYFSITGCKCTNNGQKIDFNSIDHRTITQFTSFVDVNAKEIFEGDLIETDELLHTGGIELPKKRVVRTIIFADGAFGFKGKITDCVRQSQHDSNYHKFLVVGNIFENKDLLA